MSSWGVRSSRSKTMLSYGFGAWVRYVSWIAASVHPVSLTIGMQCQHLLTSVFSLLGATRIRRRAWAWTGSWPWLPAGNRPLLLGKFPVLFLGPKKPRNSEHGFITRTVRVMNPSSVFGCFFGPKKATAKRRGSLTCGANFFSTQGRLDFTAGGA